MLQLHSLLKRFVFQIVLTEIYFDGFHRTFSDGDALDTIHENDSIYAFETPDVYIGQKGTFQ